MQHVYLLEAKAEWPDSDNYCEGSDAITTVHATLDGALAQFDRWLDGNGIDRGAAHYGEQRDAGFVGGDPDPDTFDGGIVLHWGINVTQVLG